MKKLLSSNWYLIVLSLALLTSVFFNYMQNKEIQSYETELDSCRDEIRSLEQVVEEKEEELQNCSDDLRRCEISLSNARSDLDNLETERFFNEW
jgi:septal ring factor EnvC (AmiA/AmiB activator)